MNIQHKEALIQHIDHLLQDVAERPDRLEKARELATVAINSFEDANFSRGLLLFQNGVTLGEGAFLIGIREAVRMLDVELNEIDDPVKQAFLDCWENP